MTAASLTAEYECTSWDTGDSPKTVSVTVAAGDWLLVLGATARSVRTLTTPSGGGLTYTLVASSVGSRGYPNVYAWAAPVSAPATFTLSMSASTDSAWLPWGFTVLRWASSTGAGTVAKATGDWDTPSCAVLTTTTNNVVATLAADAYASDGSSRTWLTVNGVTPTAGNGLERSYATDSYWTIYSAYWNSTGAPATKTVGLSAPDGQHFAMVAVEMLGSVAAPAPDLTGTAVFPLSTRAEAAFGADLAADPDSWTWTVLPSVLDTDENPGFAINRGRQDEASQTQPAHATLAVDNTGGWMTPRNQASPYWPYVRLQTPVRLSVLVNGTWRVRAQGYLSSIDQAWDGIANRPVAKLTVTGQLGLAGNAHSALYRLLSGAGTYHGTARIEPVVYWSFEERDTATSAAEVGGGLPLIPAGTVTWAADSSLAASAALPRFADGAAVTAVVPTYDSSAAAWTVLAVVGIPSTEPADSIRLLTITSNGDIDNWQVTLSPSWVLALTGTDWGADLLGVPTITLDDSYQGRPVLLAVAARQVGGLLRGTLAVYSMGGSHVAEADFAAGTPTVRTVAFIADTDMAFGHLAVFNTSYQSIGQLASAANAWAGESPGVRAARVCAEDGVPITLPGAVEEVGVDADLMGPQPVGTLVDILRDCETAGGLLSDGIRSGATFLPQVVAPVNPLDRGARYNRDVELALSMTAGQVPVGFEAVEDDQLLVNDSTVSGGTGSGHFQRVDGERGAAAVGVHAENASVNLSTRMLAHAAGWRVNAGTAGAMRYPTVVLNFRRAAVAPLAGAWCTMDLGSRLQITDLMASHGESVADLILEGYTERIRTMEWTAEANTSPATPWTVAIMEDATNPFRLDTAGSTLAAGASVGATSLSVATATGPLWTTTATRPGDFPFDVEISLGTNTAGRRVHVTGIVGATSPQTFTVTALAYALTSGMAVRLWHPAVLAL